MSQDLPVNARSEARVLELATKLIDAEGDEAALASLELSREPEAIRTRVDALVRSAAQMGQFLEHSPLADTTPAPTSLGLPAGTAVGAYTIIRLLGQGGTSDVYEASNPEGHHVALKIVRPGVAGPNTSRQFSKEFRALQRLEDPRIAKVLDLGTYQTLEGGRPFVVMELVPGNSLADAAKHHRPQTPAILLLMAEIADAVHHAHQRGVIHRDLKPSNIMVRPDQPDSPHAALHPKILDFGIAKVIGLDTTAVLATMTDTASTKSGGFMGTLPYMSPEQVSHRADAIDHRTDIYSLGVILYELLARRLPIDPDTRTVPGMLLAITQQTPPRIFTSPTTIQRDIDVIVSRTLAKRPEARYQSAADLALDLRAVANGRTPSIRPPSLRESLTDLYARHRLPTILASVALSIILLAAAIAIVQAVQAHRANRAKDEAFHKLVDEASVMIFDVERTVRELPGSAHARALIVQRAVSMYETARSIRPDDEDLLDRLAVAYAYLASSTGSPGDANTGQLDLGRELIAKSIQLRRHLLSLHPDDANLLASLANALKNQALFLDNQHDRWINAEESIALAQQAVAHINAHTASPMDVRRILVRCYYYGAQVAPDDKQALALFDKGLEFARACATMPGANVNDQIELATTLRFDADRRASHDPALAKSHAAEAVKILEPLLNHPTWADSARAQHAGCNTLIASIAFSQGNPDEGLPFYRSAQETLESRLTADPENGLKMTQLLLACSTIATTSSQGLNHAPSDQARQLLREITQHNTSRAIDMIRARTQRGELEPNAEARIADLQNLAARAATAAPH